MPTLKTTDVTNVRESLSDIISMLSPTETPFMSSIGKTTASAVKAEFMKDDLAPADKDNAAVEGADAGDAAQNGPIRLSNHCQIFTKTVNVSGTLNAVNTAGYKEELGRQVAKKRSRTQARSGICASFC